MANDETTKTLKRDAELGGELGIEIGELLDALGLIDFPELLSAALLLVGIAFAPADIAIALAVLGVMGVLNEIRDKSPDLGEVARTLDAQTKVLRETDKDLIKFFRAILATNVALENWSLCPCPGGSGGAGAIESQGGLSIFGQGQQASALQSMAVVTRNNSPNRRSVNVRIHNFTGGTASIRSNRNSQGGHDVEVAIGTHPQSGVNVGANSQMTSAVESGIS